MNKHTLKIGWLYPQLMNTYGDRGNIIVLTKRCEWRDIHVEVKYLNEGFAVKDLEACDLLFMGGAQDKQQQIVSEDLKKEKVKALSSMIEDNIPGLYICGAYQFLGKYYKEADGTMIPGLGIFDLYTENPGTHIERLIGNISVDVIDEHKKLQTLVGFENHGGRTYLGKDIKPLGHVVHGYGNNGGDKTEGAIYKNSFGSYMHGPILPKNPFLADLLIQKALVEKYGKEMQLKKLDDSFEEKAHEVILKRLH
ncbi:MAG: cobalamin biosynthesis protein CobQ [Candidatus Levybacteria bacterium]|nr:cobalamin biosynthesis protein CobQ [Candidatus Levybacteria bacterium]